MTPPPFHYLNRCNALTYLSLLAGLAAMAAAGGAASWNGAWAFLGLSVLLDTFDGRFARAFERSEDEKAFGVQFDSLADGVVFGVVPPVCLFLLSDLGNSPGAFAAWATVSLFFVVCSLTRLGCYNLHQAETGHFVGMPTTLAALVVCSGAALTRSPTAHLILLALCAVLMASTVPVPRPRGWRMLLFVLWIVAAVSFHTLYAVLA